MVLVRKVREALVKSIHYVQEYPTCWLPKRRSISLWAACVYPKIIRI